jgi:hypothetical protein
MDPVHGPILFTLYYYINQPRGQVMPAARKPQYFFCSVLLFIVDPMPQSLNLAHHKLPNYPRLPAILDSAEY